MSRFDSKASPTVEDLFGLLWCKPCRSDLRRTHTLKRSPSKCAASVEPKHTILCLGHYMHPSCQKVLGLPRVRGVVGISVGILTKKKQSVANHRISEPTGINALLETYAPSMSQVFDPRDGYMPSFPLPSAPQMLPNILVPPLGIFTL